jgi:hypothetical protein
LKWIIPLLFGGDIYRQHVTTFSRLAWVGIAQVQSPVPSRPINDYSLVKLSLLFNLALGTSFSALQLRL